MANWHILLVLGEEKSSSPKLESSSGMGWTQIRFLMFKYCKLQYLGLRVFEGTNSV
jgi:hypothetical protein